MRPVVFCSFVVLPAVLIFGTVPLIPSIVSSRHKVAAATSQPAPQMESVEQDMHEFMEYVFQPTYRRLRKNLNDQAAEGPSWKAIRSDALILAESCNLLFLRQPEADADDWIRHAAAARAGGSDVYRAAQSKDFPKTAAAFRSMLNHCNACHRQFEDGRHILKP